MTGLLWAWICKMEVAMWFLMLALDTMRVYERSKEDLREILSRRWIWVLKLLLLCLGDKWEKNWLEKMFMSWELEANFLLKELKERKTLLNLLSMLTMGPLIFEHWLGVRESNNSWWEMLVSNCLSSRRDIKMWLYGREWALSCDLPQSF